MSAACSEYPVNRKRPITRGDPLDIIVRIRAEDGTPIDVAGWTWRAQIRDFADTGLHSTFEVTSTGNPGEVVMHLGEEDSERLDGGETFDLEQLTPTHRTWWICTALNVAKDVSRDDPHSNPIDPTEEEQGVASGTTGFD